jgi:hypothetical protein
LEVVALDEFIKVHTENLETNNEMLPKHELFFNSNDVFLIFWVTFAQLLYNLSFNQALLVKSLLVSENLKSHDLLLLVVLALKNLTERSFAESLNNFISVSNVMAFRSNVLIFVIVKAVVINAFVSDVFYVRILSPLNVEEINGIIV